MLWRLVVFFVSLSSLCFATDEDGCAVENFCNTLFICIYIYTYKNLYINIRTLRPSSAEVYYIYEKQTTWHCKGDKRVIGIEKIGNGDKIYRETKESLWIKKLKTFEPLGLNIKLDRHWLHKQNSAKSTS